MEQLLTEELLCELLDQDEPTKYLDRADLGVSTLSEYLNDLLVSKDLKRARLFGPRALMKLSVTKYLPALVMLRETSCCSCLLPWALH